MSDSFYNALCDHQLLEGYEEGYKDGYEAGKRDAASPWHRVEDELPKDGEWVLIWGDGFHVPIQAFHESGCWLDDQFEKYTATHWMPLPEPPEEEGT